MTQEQLPSLSSERIEPPQYPTDQPAVAVSEKTSCIPLSARTPTTHPLISFPSPSQPCTKHPSSTTPFLDAQLHTTAASSGVDAITHSLHAATDGEHCTCCTANEAARTLTRYMFEMRQAKKTGKWTKEDKKALKVEMKGLMREVKGAVREEKMRLKRESGQK
jgi:hypothetical protein